MMIVRKTATQVQAYELGTTHKVIEQLIREGKVIPKDNNTFEIISQEAAPSGHGEVMQAGDFIKVDSSGMPYPNSRQFFEENFIKVEGDTYEQKSKDLYAWAAGMAMCPEIEFLIAHKGLEIHPESAEKYFSAPLWGTTEYAAKNAVIIFYQIMYEKNEISDIDFNFVERGEFEKTYEIKEKTVD